MTNSIHVINSGHLLTCIWSALYHIQFSTCSCTPLILYTEYHTHTHTHTHTHPVHMHVHPCIHSQAGTHACTHARAHKPPHTQKVTNTHTHQLMCVHYDKHWHLLNQILPCHVKTYNTNRVVTSPHIQVPPITKRNVPTARSAALRFHHLFSTQSETCQPPLYVRQHQHQCFGGCWQTNKKQQCNFKSILHKIKHVKFHTWKKYKHFS